MWAAVVRDGYGVSMMACRSGPPRVIHRLISGSKFAACAVDSAVDRAVDITVDNFVDWTTILPEPTPENEAVHVVLYDPMLTANLSFGFT